MRSNEKRPKQRRFGLRISLRAALVLMMIVGVGLVVPAWKVRQSRRQQELIQQLKRQGMVEVYYDYEIDDDLEFDWETDQTGSGWLSDYVGESFFHDVVRIDDARDLSDGKVSYAYLRSFPRLRALSLTTRQRDVDLAPLRALHRLERLQVRCGELDDDDLSQIAGLPRLQSLSIRDAKITDRGMQRLARIATLKQLDIQTADISDEAVAELQKHRPNLQVIR